ncbi:hypothetical protein BVG16_22245 [Paenibacillus selenitireducens]|uniref:Uncharacterized protein n=1 Tax=Paenibacillus selenitireducens TaxID=1324314 RepID=A0A1T2X672_9BACL|nr:hypothetical protein [Paenibacillus selenitireducens]OPA75315.1 hypothetical protein BVG16_22245 [Paenibacillus selenitireducens]
MREIRSLLVLDRFRSLFDKLGIDYAVMRKILQVKLLMDRRRVPTVIGERSKIHEEEFLESNNFMKSLWIYGIYGAIMIPIIVMGDNYFIQMSLVFGMSMFIMMTTMISDFSSVMLDVRDISTLSTKPVDPKTIRMAKTMHISIYMFILTFVLMAPGWVASIIRHGIGFGLIYLLETILMDMFILVMTSIVYLVVLKLYDGERLKDIINYVQIGLSIGVAVGYQLVIRSFDLVQSALAWTPTWWNFFIPPLWFAAPFELLKGNRNGYYIAFTVLALCVPICLFLTYTKFMPAFEQNLIKLMHSQSMRSAKSSHGVIQRLSKWICRSTEEQAFFRFALRMLGSEREFKLKVYPSVALMAVLPFIFIFSGLRSKSWAELADSKLYFTIYLSLMMIPTVVNMLKYSGRYKGSWIYTVAPIQNIALLHRGTIKAVMVRLFLPIYLILCMVLIGVFGITIIPHLMIIMFSANLYLLLCYQWIGKSLPFSVSFAGAQQESQWTIFPLVLLLLPFAAVHFGISNNSYAVYGYMVILVLVNAVMWKFMFRGTRPHDSSKNLSIHK